MLSLHIVLVVIFKMLDMCKDFQTNILFLLSELTLVIRRVLILFIKPA